MSVDTFSGFLIASAQSRETASHVIRHCLIAFATLNIPHKIKTDNRSGYTSKKFQRFCTQFQIKHITDIPYYPQGQNIVERA